MLEVVACLTAVAVCLLYFIAKLLVEFKRELINIQELLWSQKEDEPDQEQLVRQYIGQMLDNDIELQRRKFWNGH